ncbi:MAG: hypothetical protein IPK80_20695 [Nannocystis sp.]|nr:hypothetical protein [Nannocystis sp.]
MSESVPLSLSLSLSVALSLSLSVALAEPVVPSVGSLSLTPLVVVGSLALVVVSGSLVVEELVVAESLALPCVAEAEADALADPSLVEADATPKTSLLSRQRSRRRLVDGVIAVARRCSPAHLKQLIFRASPPPTVVDRPYRLPRAAQRPPAGPRRSCPGY